MKQLIGLLCEVPVYIEIKKARDIYIKKMFKSKTYFFTEIKHHKIIEMQKICGDNTEK